MSVIRKRTFLLGIFGWLEIGIVLACIVLSNEECGKVVHFVKPATFCSYRSTADIKITPTGRKALVVNECLTITCTATGCNNTGYFQLFEIQSGTRSGFSSKYTNCLPCNISIEATEDIVLLCGLVRNTTLYSEETLEILVQS